MKTQRNCIKFAGEDTSLKHLKDVLPLYMTKSSDYGEIPNENHVEE